MNAMRMASVLMILGVTAVPATAQGMGMEKSGDMMDAGMMQMCHAMMGGDMDGGVMKGGEGAMAGHGMMAGGGMAGMKDMQDMDGMSSMMSMAQGVGFGPAALLAAADRLQLTAEQRSRLDALAQTAGLEHKNHMKAIMEARQDATTILKAESPDLDAHQRTLQLAADHMVQAHMAITRASVEARGILTAEQRSQLQDGMALTGSMMCGIMGGADYGESGGHAQHIR